MESPLCTAPSRAALSYLRSCLHASRGSRPRTGPRTTGLQASPRARRNQHSGSNKSRGHIARSGEQANPLSGFYAEMLSKSLPEVTPATRTAPTPASRPPTTDKEEVLAKARIVFGTRLAGPGRQAERMAQATEIAGVLVPPKPEEPDNCCMSGCVNCVWDVYRDEIEEWAAASKLAKQRQREQAAKLRQEGRASGSMVAEPGAPAHVMVSMDDDGGGSEANWGVGGVGAQEADLFEGIPVGIRQFMETEKALKMKHRAAGEKAEAIAS
ncbi:hypothetical protein H2201_001744 [Coniosporium apollinis]|uniref:Oxidoreductase-like domain-containing protein n=1 Tax=Coniosporium apollinis TaxID=61459 RepID=A0ABQ9P319_9PEZI|nr:hypothetical protein H2201_001744 [Coniosporium apollinis]